MNGVDARVNFRCIFEGFGKIVRHYNRQDIYLKKGTERQNPLSFFNSCSCERRNSAENSAGKSKICVIFNFLTQEKSGNVNVSSVILCPIFLSITLKIALLY